MGNICANDDGKTKKMVENVGVGESGFKKDDKHEPMEPEPMPTEPENAEEEQKLSISIVGARGLRDSGWLPGSGKPDCYCELKRGSTLLYTTQVIRNACEPVWLENCNDAALEDGAPLEFCIYDRDIIASEVLGKAILESKDYAEGFNGELQLIDAQVDQAYLKVKVQVSGKDLPKGPPSEFTLTLEKPSQDASFGIDLDTQSSDILFVLGLKEGPAQEYNETAQPEYQVQSNDAIVSVNGKTGSIGVLLDQLRSEMKVEILVRRTVTTSIIFNRGEASEPLGLEFSPELRGDLLMLKGIAGGAAEKHNAAAKDHEKLHAGDRISSVGKLKSVKASKLLDQLEKSEGQVMLVLTRLVAPPASEEPGDEPRAVHWLFG